MEALARLRALPGFLRLAELGLLEKLLAHLRQKQQIKLRQKTQH
jgi:hypothetical protein